MLNRNFHNWLEHAFLNFLVDKDQRSCFTLVYFIAYIFKKFISYTKKNLNNNKRLPFKQYALGFIIRSSFRYISSEITFSLTDLSSKNERIFERYICLLLSLNTILHCSRSFLVSFLCCFRWGNEKKEKKKGKKGKKTRETELRTFGHAIRFVWLTRTFQVEEK